MKLYKSEFVHSRLESRRPRSEIRPSNFVKQLNHSETFTHAYEYVRVCVCLYERTYTFTALN